MYIYFVFIFGIYLILRWLYPFHSFIIQHFIRRPNWIFFQNLYKIWLVHFIFEWSETVRWKFRIGISGWYRCSSKNSIFNVISDSFSTLSSIYNLILYIFRSIKMKICAYDVCYVHPFLINPCYNNQINFP